MRGTYRESNTKHRSTFYIILSIAFIVILFKWGLPAFFNLISGPASKQTQTAYDDNVPPQIPLISALPEATNSSSLKVEGYTEKNVDTELLINDVTADSIKSDDNGAFVLSGKLENGDNRVIVRAKDSTGISSQSEVILVNFDNKSIELSKISPNEGTEFFGSTGQNVEIKGVVNKKTATVIVNNSFTMVDKDGNFSQKVTLSNGENSIKIKASDQAGNTTETNLKLIFNP